jgi:protein-tyrosine kinase
MNANTPAATRTMNRVDQPAGLNAQELPPQSIGHILVSAGRLTPEAAEQIHRKQSDNNILFGETGVALGLISREDLEYAIARQFEYSVLKKGDSAISEDLVSAYDPFGAKAEAFRELRTHLLLRWIETEPRSKTLSVLSTQRGEGRSYVASNLAVSFSQLGLKTLLLDADLRHSRLHHLFGVSGRRGLSSILQGKGDPGFIVQIPDIRNLSVLPAGPHAPNPQELLSQVRFPELLNELAGHFDLVIVDTPAALLYSDAMAISTRTSAAIAVARQGHSRVEHLRQLKESMSRAGGNLLGSVLLDF